ncbi:MAG: acetylglutamate kinase, partial [Salinibacterium sp.]|nr:acetylglutamate kinase [Salinibacterium sp.]
LGDGGALEVSQTSVAELGRVGTVTGGDAGLWKDLLASGRTPVVASIGLDTAGTLLNVNADDAALGAAIAVGARGLVLVTDTAGVLDADREVIGELTAERAEALIESGTIHSGMIPKVAAALAAAEQLGAPVHIVPACGLGSALAGEPIGTVVMPPSRSRPRDAKASRAGLPV